MDLISIEGMEEPIKLSLVGYAVAIEATQVTDEGIVFQIK